MWFSKRRGKRYYAWLSGGIHIGEGKVLFPHVCACGCGVPFPGRRNQKWFNHAHQRRGQRLQIREERGGLVGKLALAVLLLIFLLAPRPARAYGAPPDGHWAGSSGSCTSTAPLSVTVSPPAGDLLIVWANVSSGNTMTVSDSSSQTYSVTNTTGGSIVSAAYYVTNTAAITSVKLTPSSTGPTCHALILAHPAPSTATLDVGGAVANGTPSTTCTAPSETTTNANDLVIGLCTENANSGTFTAGGTGCTYTFEATNSGGAWTVGAEDCNVTSTGTFQPAPTFSSSNVSRGATLAFKLSGAAPTCPKTLALLGVGC
jgi:hypothetical protein